MLWELKKKKWRRQRENKVLPTFFDRSSATCLLAYIMEVSFPFYSIAGRVKESSLKKG